MVTPTTEPQTINLGGTYYLATPSGGGLVPEDGNLPTDWLITYTAVTEVTLAPNRAAVLFDSQP